MFCDSREATHWATTKGLPSPPIMAEGEGICVAIRVRPLSGRERIQGQRAIWRCLPNYNSITQTNAEGNPLPERNTGSTFFTFDKVFDEESTTTQVYEAIGKPIVSSVVQGFNGTIFAYGQVRLRSCDVVKDD